MRYAAFFALVLLGGCSRRAEPPTRVLGGVAEPAAAVKLAPAAPQPVAPAQPANTINTINVINDNRRVCPDVVHE